MEPSAETREVAEVTIDTKQERINPQTGRWEYLSFREWKNLKSGVPRDSRLSPVTLAILRGPEFALLEVFRNEGITESGNPGGLIWLKSLYVKWFPRNPKEQELLHWKQFICDMYYVERECYIRDEFIKVQISFLKVSIDKQKLVKDLKRAEQFHSNKFARNDSKRNR